MRRLLPLLLAWALFCCSAPALAGGAGSLTIGITQAPSTLHPNIDSMLAKSYLLGFLRRPLTQYDQDWKLVNMLAETLPTFDNGLAEKVELDNGDEGIRTTWTIHPQAAWGDGTPVTTEDVVFTYDVGSTPQSGVATTELYKRIVEIEVVDEKTFRVTGDRITFSYNSFGDFGLLPAQIERPVFEADPASYRNRTAFDNDPTNPGLHYGPYRLASLDRGSSYTLEPNPTWYGPEPAFDRIVLRVIEDTAALQANLLSGAIDMISGELGLTADQAVPFAEGRGKAYNILFQPGLIYEHIDLMLDNPVLQDRRVRQALLHAIDRELLVEQLFAGTQPVAHSSVSPLDRMHSEDIPTYDHDPAKAAALLEEAGWTEIKDGIRHNAAGEELSFEIMTTAGNRNRELVQQVLQSMWREAGIEIVIRNQPPRVLFGETVRKREYEALAMYAWISAPESVPYSTLHSTQIPSAENGWSGQNSNGYANPEMDALLERLERELDPAERKGLWRELQRIYATDLPVLPLYWRSDAYVLPNWLKGVRPTGHLGPSSLWVEEWTRAEGG
ncbi:MAG: peptide ABC transporter substrate-binding protein [Rhodovibrionaceae bacterium]